MEFDWWSTIQAHKKLLNVHVLTVIGYVLIGPWMLFSQYVMECKLFGSCIVSKEAEKHILT